MRRFQLVRHIDTTGFSGVGLVAEGVAFRDGRATVRWCVPDKPASTVDWDRVADAVEVHGHGGDTVLVWTDLEHQEMPATGLPSPAAETSIDTAAGCPARCAHRKLIGLVIVACSASGVGFGAIVGPRPPLDSARAITAYLAVGVGLIASALGLWRLCRDHLAACNRNTPRRDVPT